MRTLPSVAGATWVRAALSIVLTAQDGSRSFTFGMRDLVSLTGLSFEVPFMGGLAKPSTYDVTLSTSLGWLKEMLPQLPRAQVCLRVDANSDTFYPHVGRVRGVTRGGADPNQVTLRVYDQLLDYNPPVPTQAIVDSWSTPHAQDLSQGYPLYYGRHLRPLYHTAVTCDLGVLLGPRNVSSANHLGGVWFCSDLSKGNDVVGGTHNILMNKAWQQQSGASNVVSGGYPFEVTDAGALDTRFWSFESGLRQSDSVANVNTPAVVRVCNLGYVDLVAFKETADGGQHTFYGTVLLRKQIQQTIQRTTRVRLCTTIANIASGGTTQTRFYVDSAGSSLLLTLPVPDILQPSNVASGDLDVSSGNGRFLFSFGQTAYYECFHSGSETGLVTMATSMQLAAQLASAGYRRYSVFSPVVNSAEVAISSNPIAILDDVLSHHVQVPYRQDQSSQAQVAVQSYQFQCFLAERGPLLDLLDEFGRTCAFYAWAGDSGMLQYRVYQESAAAAVNRLVTTSDMLGMTLLQNPLGTTAFESNAASRLVVDYGYDFQLGQYTASAVAGPSNNAFCGSVAASGVQRELRLQSRHILDADTASYALGNQVRKYAQGLEYVQLSLPARFFDLELADVLRVQHPALTGSEGLYQVTRLEPDYQGGTVQVTASKLLNLTDPTP